jgi:hypothetical protein
MQQTKFRVLLLPFPVAGWAFVLVMRNNVSLNGFFFKALGDYLLPRQRKSGFNIPICPLSPEGICPIAYRGSLLICALKEAVVG